MTRTKGTPILDDYYLVLSTRFYEWFLKHDRCGDEEHPRLLREDALRLYQHYLYAAVKQKTASVWATVEYLAKGCAMGTDRVKRARAFLVQHGLICYRQDLSSGGDRRLRRGKVYTVIALRPSVSGSVISKPPENRAENGTSVSGGVIVSRAEAQPARQPAPELLEESIEVLEEEKEYIAGSPPADEEPLPSGLTNGAGDGDNGKPRQKPKHSPEEVAVFRSMGDLIRSRGPAWSGVKDSEGLYRLMKFAKGQQPARWEEYLQALIDGAWQLHQGTIPAMNDFDKRRWADLPYTPSRMNGQQLEATLTRLTSIQDDTPSFEEMERAGIGQPGGPKPWEW